MIIAHVSDSRQRKVFAVYRDAGKIVGYCYTIRPYEGNVYLGDILELSVDAKYEGRGIGKALLAFMSDHLVRLGAEKIHIYGFNPSTCHIARQVGGFYKLNDPRKTWVLERQKIASSPVSDEQILGDRQKLDIII